MTGGTSTPLLVLEGLAKRYRTGDLALNHVNLNIPQGQVLTLIGPSGAGKSTLIRCINRLVEPTAGRVLLDGVEIRGDSARRLREHRRTLGMIFQEYALVERLSVMENVLSGRLGYTGFWRSWWRRYPQADIDRAFYFLERVGLSGFENKRADALSGGQRQRVGIARALMQNPRLLLVDEPTASLDPKTARQIMRLICEICREQGLSAVINIHDVALARRFADRMVGLHKGTIVHDGPPDTLDDMALTAIYGAEDWGAEKHSETGAAQSGEQGVGDALRSQGGGDAPRSQGDGDAPRRVVPAMHANAGVPASGRGAPQYRPVSS